MRAFALTLTLGLLLAAAASGAAQPRQTMHEIFEALAYLLPASLEAERLGEPEEAARVEAQLDALAAAAQSLEQHAKGRDPGFRFLSRSLAADVTEIRDRWREGRVEEARYYLFELTQNCVACHSRLPSAREFPLADRLVAHEEVAALDRRERARLMVAVRRFDAALGAWESLFADASVPPAELDISGDLVDYLTIALRVKRDGGRAGRALAKLDARPDVPRYLHRHLRTWMRSLEEHAPELVAEPTLARGRALVKRADVASEFPAGRERLVIDLIASSVLHRSIEAAEGPGPGVAEAFFWLGVIEARSGDSYWVPQAELHLEAAVRIDPKGPYAERAYDLLEEYVMLGFGATSDAELAPRMRETLAELRALIDEARASAPASGG